MRKEKKVYTLDPFQQWSHRFGRVCMILFFIYMLAIPVIVGIVKGAMPDAQMLLTACVGICITYIPSASRRRSATRRFSARRRIWRF